MSWHLIITNNPALPKATYLHTKSSKNRDAKLYRYTLPEYQTYQLHWPTLMDAFYIPTVYHAGTATWLHVSTHSGKAWLLAAACRLALPDFHD
jgi:hypothetical protein